MVAIKCQVSNCKYNEHNRCHAETIKVEAAGGEVSAKEAKNTLCHTFIAKGY